MYFRTRRRPISLERFLQRQREMTDLSRIKRLRGPSQAKRKAKAQAKRRAKAKAKAEARLIAEAASMPRYGWMSAQVFRRRARAIPAGTQPPADRVPIAWPLGPDGIALAPWLSGLQAETNGPDLGRIRAVRG